MNATVFPVTIFTVSHVSDPFNSALETYIRLIERDMNDALKRLGRNLSPLHMKDFYFDIERSEITLRYKVEFYGPEVLVGEEYHNVMREIRAKLSTVFGVDVG